MRHAAKGTWLGAGTGLEQGEGAEPVALASSGCSCCRWPGRRGRGAGSGELPKCSALETKTSHLPGEVPKA